MVQWCAGNRNRITAKRGGTLDRILILFRFRQRKGLGFLFIYFFLSFRCMQFQNEWSVCCKNLITARSIWQIQWLIVLNVCWGLASYNLKCYFIFILLLLLHLKIGDQCSSKIICMLFFKFSMIASNNLILLFFFNENLNFVNSLYGKCVILWNGTAQLYAKKIKIKMLPKKHDR